MTELSPDIKAKRLPEMLPRFEYAFETRVITGNIMRMPFGAGERLMVEVAGGDIDGPMLKGRILPGGVEWPTYVDNVGIVDARYTFQSDDGVFINIRNRGYRRAEPEVLERMNRLEWVEPTDYYIRTTPMFEAPPGKYEWMARHCFVGIGERQPECLFMRYYMVL